MERKTYRDVLGYYRCVYCDREGDTRRKIKHFHQCPEYNRKVTMLPFQVNVSSRFGAPMGRHSDAPGNIEGRKLHLRHVPFVDGCYDQGGAYWGSPANLWCAWDDECVFYFRATNREAAKAYLTGARFYR